MMFNSYERYALSWVPRSGSPLARFGAAWTGWCADAGEKRPRMSRSGLPMAPERVTGTLSRQGMHAVIRPPFELPDGISYWALERELAAMAETMEPFTLPRLAVAVTQGRIALVPTTASEALDRFLWQIERRLRPFEAASGGGVRTTTDARAAMTGGHEEADCVRFAIPLTGRLAPEDAERLAKPLAGMLEPILRETQHVTDFAVIAVAGSARPHFILDRVTLQGGDRSGTQGLKAYGPTVITTLGASPEATEIV